MKHTRSSFICTWNYNKCFNLLKMTVISCIERTSLFQSLTIWINNPSQHIYWVFNCCMFIFLLNNKSMFKILKWNERSLMFIPLQCIQLQFNNIKVPKLLKWISSQDWKFIHPYFCQFTWILYFHLDFDNFELKVEYALSDTDTGCNWYCWQRFDQVLLFNIHSFFTAMIQSMTVIAL